MIATSRPVRRQAAAPKWHRQFLAMLPVIRKYAKRAFQYLDAEAREDAVHEVTANAVVAFARLVELGKVDLAHPTVLARYGIAQARDGRRVGNRRRVGEVLSGYAQRKKGFVVERLDRFDKESGEWLEAVVEDPRTPVPDQVAFRVDFPTWLKLQTPRNRRIAEALAVGSTTARLPGGSTSPRAESANSAGSSIGPGRSFRATRLRHVFELRLRHGRPKSSSRRT